VVAEARPPPSSRPVSSKIEAITPCRECGRACCGNTGENCVGLAGVGRDARRAWAAAARQASLRQRVFFGLAGGIMARQWALCRVADTLPARGMGQQHLSWQSPVLGRARRDQNLAGSHFGTFAIQVQMTSLWLHPPIADHVAHNLGCITSKSRDGSLCSC